MKVKKVILKSIGIMALVVSFGIFTSTVMAEANMYEFKLQAYGGADRSDDLLKETSGAGQLWVDGVYANVDKPIVARFRLSTTKEMCSESTSFSKYVGLKKLLYWKGYGKLNIEYYLRIQTDTYATKPATVVGVVMP